MIEVLSLTRERHFVMQLCIRMAPFCARIADRSLVGKAKRLFREMRCDMAILAGNAGTSGTFPALFAPKLGELRAMSGESLTQSRD